MDNSLEFAFGMDPTKPDSRGLAADGTVNCVPVPVLGKGGGIDLCVIRCKDRDTPGGVSYTAQFGSELIHFFDNKTPPTFVANSNSNSNYEVVKVPYPAYLPDARPRRFGRLMVGPVS